MILAKSDKGEMFANKIVSALFFEGEFSCAELSEKIDRSIPLTTQYINRLLKSKKLVEKGFASSTGGRRPQTYAITPGSFYIVAVAMDQLVTRLALINEANEMVGDVRAEKLRLAGNREAMPQLARYIESFIQQSGCPRDKIVGIGIGMPGFVDTKKGINHSFLPTGSLSIPAVLHAATGIPAVIDNDSSLIALAELKWGAARRRKNVMVVNIGWGVGLGIIINGSLFRGHDGFAGEFSHIPLFDNHKLCSCGKYGCLETETSMGVVVHKALEGLRENRLTALKNISEQDIETSAKAIIDAVKKGDKYSVEVLSESAYNIGRGVAILIHLLNPETIVISGIGSLAGKAWIAPIQQAINEHCIPKIAENTTVEISTLGYDAELIGAAALVMDHYEELMKTGVQSVKAIRKK